MITEEVADMNASSADNDDRNGRGARPGHGSLLAVLTAVCVSTLLSLGGCSDPLAVEDPDIAQPEDLTGQAGLESRRLGAFGDFAIAYSGSSGDAGQVLYSGAFVDEFIITGTFPTRTQIDARRVDNNNGSLAEFYSNLHRARRAAEASAQAWSEADTLSGTASVLAELNNLAGYTYVFFGENFCSGVPFSRVTPDGALEFGEGSSTEETFQTAISRFDAAASSAQSAGDTDLLRLARVGKARSLLNTGRFDEAARAVSDVPTGWEFTVKHSTNSDRQENGVMAFTNLDERWSVANEEGGGLAFRDAFTAGDPRTPWQVAPDSAAFNTNFVGYHEMKYPTRDSPVPLASGVEARLIEAEAALQAGNTGDFEQIHNALRARLDADAVGPIDTDTMSQRQMEDFHFRERAMWLWLTGHRHGDVRRMVRQYGRSAEEVFPTGPYFKVQFEQYGDMVVFPIPRQETNNPNFSDQTRICQDLNA